jgi:hypothetical protein
VAVAVVGRVKRAPQQADPQTPPVAEPPRPHWPIRARRNQEWFSL